MSERCSTSRLVTSRCYPAGLEEAGPRLSQWHACGLARNEVKAVHEPLCAHACGLPMARHAFVTFGPAFPELCGNRELLSDSPYTEERSLRNQLGEEYAVSFRATEGIRHGRTACAILPQP